MNLSYNDLPDWAQWLVGLAVIIAAVLAVFGFVKKVWPVLSKFVVTVNALSDLPQFMITTAKTLADQDVKIEQIHHEVNYNNGSSVKDAVKRVEAGVKGIYVRLDTQDLRFDSADQDRLELREDLEQTKPRTPARKRPAKPKGETL